MRDDTVDHLNSDNKPSAATDGPPHKKSRSSKMTQSSVLQRQHRRDASLLSPTNGNATRRYAIMRHPTTRRPRTAQLPLINPTKKSGQPAADLRPTPTRALGPRVSQAPADPRGCTDRCRGRQRVQMTQTQRVASVRKQRHANRTGRTREGGFLLESIRPSPPPRKKNHNNVQRVATAS